jgi:hypothetical protein
MSVPYPKNPQEIRIRITNCDVEEGLLSSIKTTAEVTLSEKLTDYLLRLGYSSAHIMGIVVRLLTKSKVRVDFKNHTERLELLDAADALTAPQAISLLEDFIAQTKHHTGEVGDARLTQRIIVQPPKFPRPEK